MTKNIRIENADNSNYKVRVEVWDKGRDGNPDTLAKVVDIDYPTMLATEYITNTRYLKIVENGTRTTT